MKNYLGFYTGCLLWAVYIKKFENKPIIANICFGGEYSENETTEEVNFIEKYIEQLKKDVKYYTGQNFEVDYVDAKLLDYYREFLKVNKGFVEAKTTDDLKLPEQFKTPTDKELDKILKGIEDVIENGKLYELFPLLNKVL